MKIVSKKNKTNKEQRSSIMSKFSLYTFFCRIIHGMILVSWTYSIALVMMSYFIPMFSAKVASGMGISYKSEILDILGLWLLPCVFMVLLFLYLTIVSIKVLHEWLKKNFDRSINKHYLQKQTKKQC